MTTDKQVVVHHDRTLTRTTGVTKNITDLSWQQLKTIDIANHSATREQETHRIPLLAEVCELIQPGGMLTIELKDSRAECVTEVLKVLQALAVEDQVLVACHDHQTLVNARKILGPDIPTNLSITEAQEFIHFLLGGMKGDYRPPGKALQTPITVEHVRDCFEDNGQKLPGSVSENIGISRELGENLGNPQLIAAAHQLGMEVHYWTINDPQLAETLIKFGADGIITDNPALIKKTLLKC